jgi:hypothetical protein
LPKPSCARRSPPLDDRPRATERTPPRSTAAA